MLYEPARHEPLLARPWDPNHVHDAIRAIVADTVAAMDADITWPPHPLDEPQPQEPRHKSLYLGSAGTLLALAYLAREGAVELTIDPRALIDRVHAAYLATPDTGAVVPSLFLGDVGISLLQWRLASSVEVADRLYAAIESNIRNPTNEALWGAPGTMLGAWHMLQWTRDPRWRELFLANADELVRTWQWSERAACHVWTQDLYGKIVQYLGAAHGFAGNVYPLVLGAALLPAEQREMIFDRCVATLRATAVIDGDAANWPPAVDSAPGRLLLQWCHGAPGIITAVADLPPRDDIDDLLRKGGNAIWQAGPLAKGPGICHGTAGNGYAFLKLYRRSGDASWLDRARAFAMHAIAQCESARAEHGRRRYTLWTGDLGVAVYLWHCVSGLAEVPGLDVI